MAAEQRLQLMYVRVLTHTTHPGRTQCMASMDVVDVDDGGGSASAPQAESKQSTPPVPAHHKSQVRHKTRDVGDKLKSAHEENTYCVTFRYFQPLSPTNTRVPHRVPNHSRLRFLNVFPTLLPIYRPTYSRHIHR